MQEQAEVYSSENLVLKVYDVLSQLLSQQRIANTLLRQRVKSLELDQTAKTWFSRGDLGLVIKTISGAIDWIRAGQLEQSGDIKESLEHLLRQLEERL